MPTPALHSLKALLPCRLLRLFLLMNLLLLSGCATVGANLALDLAKQEEAQDCAASDPGAIRKIDVKDCERISRLINKAGISGGFVGYDRSGRIKLKGTFQNEDEIDLAYMIAITVVGVNSLEISPVTPRDLNEIKLVKTSSQTSVSEEKGQKYALLIGVSKFKHAIKPIETAVKDVNSIKALLKKNGFKQENIIELTDEQATKSGILTAMHAFEDKVTAKDSIVVYISTHGTSPDTFGKMGIIPYDLVLPNFKQIPHFNGDVQSFANQISKDETGDPAIIQIARDRIKALKTAVSFDNLLDFFTSIKTDKFVAILDTCYSGAAVNTLTYPVGGAQYAEREHYYSQSQDAENKAKLLGSGNNCKLTEYNEKALSTLKHPQTDMKCQENVAGKGLILTDETGPTTSERGIMTTTCWKLTETRYPSAASRGEPSSLRLAVMNNHCLIQADYPILFSAIILLKAWSNRRDNYFLLLTMLKSEPKNWSMTLSPV